MDNTQPSPQPQVPVPPVSKPPIRFIDPLKKTWAEIKTSPKFKKFAILFVAGWIVVLILLILLSLVLRANRNRVTPPLPTPISIDNSPSPEPQIQNPSKYATDAAVLEIEKNINDLDKSLGSTNLRESDLQIPNLHFEEPKFSN